MYFRRRFNALGPLVDCRGLVSFLPEIVGDTSLVKMEGKEGKCEGFRSLDTFIDATINYYCMCGDLLVDYVSQKAAPTYHFVVVFLCVFRSENFEARFLKNYFSWVRLVCLVIKISEGAILIRPVLLAIYV